MSPCFPSPRRLGLRGTQPLFLRWSHMIPTVRASATVMMLDAVNQAINEELGRCVFCSFMTSRTSATVDEMSDSWASAMTQ